MENKMDDQKSAAYRIGVAVMILLIVLTIGEFFIGKIAVGWTWPLWGIAIIKTFFIVRDYMHLPRLFGEGEE
jgi:hypothetical protein